MAKQTKTRAQIQEFKKTISQLYPNAIVNIKGKDTILMELRPGTDLKIFDDGTTVITRSYTSTKPELRRKSSMEDSFYEYYDQGYRPIRTPANIWLANRENIRKSEKIRENQMSSIFPEFTEVKRRPAARKPAPSREVPYTEREINNAPMEANLNTMQPMPMQQQQRYDPNFYDKVLIKEIAQRKRGIRNSPQLSWPETPASITGEMKRDINAVDQFTNSIFALPTDKKAQTPAQKTNEKIKELKDTEKARKRYMKEQEKIIKARAGN